MRGACLIAAVIGFGCDFTSPPPITSDAPPIDAVDAPPDVPEYIPACATDPGYTPDPATQRRYRVVTTSLDYDSATDACTEHGAHLVSINSDVENNYLRTRITGDTWIGLDDLTNEGVLRWINGAPLSFQGFIPPEPNDNGTEDCTHLRQDGTWNDADCAQTRPAICECDAAFKPPPTPMCRTLAAGAQLFDGRRYFVHNDAKTWPAAKLDCESIGAYLAVISDFDENQNIDQLFNTEIWIGYSDTQAEGTFVWVSGGATAYNHWRGGAPPAIANPTENCVEIDHPNGEWNDAECTGVKPYVCECDPLAP